MGPETFQILYADMPPGAKGMFVGDRLGGSGWFVPMPDGTQQTYYVTLPEHLTPKVDYHLPGAPNEHLGRPLRAEITVQELGRMYLDYLTRLVSAAEQEFSTAH
jgi:hypothetical protein